MSVGTAAGVDDFEAQQRHRLVKSMRRFDLVFFGVATVVSLDTIGYILGLRGADVHLDARARPAVRPAVRAADVGDGRRVRPRRRPVPLDAPRLGTRGRGARGGAVLDHEPALARRLARVPGDRGVEQQPHEDRGRLGVGLRLQARLHLDRDPRRRGLAQARQVDPDDRRVREDRPRRRRVRDGRHLRRRARRPRCRRGRLRPDPRGLPRRRSAPDVRHERLRVQDGRGRGDARRPARRATRHRRLRGRVGRLLPAPDPRDPRRHAREPGLERRGLHGRGDAQLQRLRPGPGRARRPRRAGVHLHPAHPGRGVDDGLGPRARRRRHGRHVPPLRSVSSATASARPCA